jgi:ubiquinone/menaquinone biosynthesis C-methylase UbiE
VASEPEQWQLEGEASTLYERFLVPLVTLPWAVDLVARVGVHPGDRVLDVACGTGAAARVAAAEVGEDGRVAGLDLNPGMLAVARSSTASVEWHEGSAQSLPFADGEFDVVLCQLGLQFFPDPLAAVREFRRALVHGGRAGASVFSGIERNPATHALSDALDRHVGEGASRAKRQEHSLADVRELEALFADAGFADVRVETVARMIRFASPAEYVRVQLTATPLAALITSSREQLLDALTAAVGERLGPYAREDGLVFPQEVHVALATA